MLIKLRLQNCFKHQDRTIDFTTGLTAITGPNESGKSLIFEMIGYALFGTVALRGAADDYKKMSVTLEFKVLDKMYIIKRAGSKVLLSIGGHEVASGTKIVNPKIIEILGYDYKVFSIANCANQDELNKLSTMKPTERKQLVDNVIGLNIIDKLSASVAAKASELNMAVEIMRTNLVEPVLPAGPSGYQPSSEINAMINQLTPDEQKFHALKTFMATTYTEPQQPANPGHNLDELIDQKTKASALVQEGVELEKQLNSYREPTMTLTQINELREVWNKINLREELQTKMRFIVGKPQHTLADLTAWQKQAEQHQLWVEKQRLLSQGSYECPKCHHDWPVAAADLEKYDNVVETAAPPYNATQRDFNHWKAYDEQKEQREALETQLAELADIPTPSVSLSHVYEQEQAINNFEPMQKAKARFEELKEHFSKAQPDFNYMIGQQRQYENDYATYKMQLTNYENWKAQLETNKTEFERVKGVPDQMQVLRQLYTNCVVYESQLQTYQQQKTLYEQRQLDVATKSMMLNQYEKVRVALKEARSTVKQYLVPSLNRVSSALLAQMTGGERSSIIITEDFDIFVDGQAINTLSGSGKAVANLAIRIALGQVLIAKKFPVFMADEIDGSMDADRAEFTSECLRRLTKHVSQLLLISHKRPAADHYIELGR